MFLFASVKLPLSRTMNILSFSNRFYYSTSEFGKYTKSFFRSLSKIALPSKSPQKSQILFRQNVFRISFSSVAGGTNGDNPTGDHGKLPERGDYHAFWDRYYQSLLRWSEQHDGNCNIPFKEKVTLEDGSEANLGYWLNTQRGLYKRGELREERQNLLQSLVDDGRLVWEVDYEAVWDRQYEAILEWSRQHEGEYLTPVENNSSDKE
mmetsp:Transcript_36446/g.37127  ORF Transcript_36446/g.37127 Transcript_36446/m.37127 type:complete len:207 (+) Transcript_36446:77-697(+)